jgi:hypothetical protein
MKWQVSPKCVSAVLSPGQGLSSGYSESLQLELGRAGYAIIGADRASGWLKAQRRIDRFIEVASADIYATVIPVSSGTGAPVAVAIVSPLH